MKEENYLVIQGFMRTKLNLKGSDLLAYALIYGFSQDGDNWFTGSMSYIAEWLGVTRQNAMACMKRLVDNGLIERRERVINGVKFVDYKAINNTGCAETVQPPCAETVHHNTTSDNLEIKESVSKDTPKKGTYDDILEARGIRGKKRYAVLEYIKMRKLIKKPLTDHALELALNNLEKLSSSEEEQIAILEQSISNSWQGLFPLKGSTQNDVGKVAHAPSEYDYDFDLDKYLEDRKRSGK